MPKVLRSVTAKSAQLQKEKMRTIQQIENKEENQVNDVAIHSLQHIAVFYYLFQIAECI